VNYENTQNVLKMSTVSRDTSSEMVTSQTHGCNNSRTVQLPPFD